jgi:hypothetical protein
MVFGRLAGRSSAEEYVINRTESKLIALERRNQAARAKRSDTRVVASDARSANDEDRRPKKTAPAA